MIILEGAGALEPRTVSLTHAAVLCVAPGYCSLELSFPRKLPSSVASSPPCQDRQFVMSKRLKENQTNSTGLKTVVN